MSSTAPQTPDFEKLGVFYLGRCYDLEAGESTPGLILYDSKDLVTHALCVGMTGSGKTGLCISLLEEAAIDGIPAIVIDPKGDLANLLLTFPSLSAREFEPWVSDAEARKQGLSVGDLAKREAERWKKGLADWGQDGSRIDRLRASAQFAIYTPGSNAGIPVNILESFSAPEPGITSDPELLRERIGSTVASLSALLGIDADPLKSRESILLSTILGYAWKEGRDLDLAALIQQVQTPPVTRVGVMELESFFPAQERFALAMQLNNLLASPGFEAWTQGEPIDIARLLYGPTGQPRIAIFSIAHLSDSERMFVVTLLLSRVLGWMRTQPGTASLRAIVYMDEIFGYFPPIANPPSKGPLLTLLKQARAFGVGIVLATQNPVDLDYKGLSNAGTWFLGRLQTERDKARVLEGLEGASAAGGKNFDRPAMERTLAALGSRLFLLHNVHEDEHVVFQARWAMSYLRGPLTRTQIGQLMQSSRPTTSAAATSSFAAEAVAGAPSGTLTSMSESCPVLPPTIIQRFVPVRGPVPDGSSLVYRPMLLGRGTVYFVDYKLGVDTGVEFGRMADLSNADRPDWQQAESVMWTLADLESEAQTPARFVALPGSATKAKSYDIWKKSLADYWYRNEALNVFKCPSISEYSKPGESERDFRVRIQQQAREHRDSLATRLREKYAPKIAALEERVRRSQQAVERETEQARYSHLQTAIAFGTTILGAFLGRKRISMSSMQRASTTARGLGRSAKESSDIGRAKENVASLQEQLAELESSFQDEVNALTSRVDPLTEAIETIAVRPKKTNVSVTTLHLVWTPSWLDGAGSLHAAWK